MPGQAKQKKEICISALLVVYQIFNPICREILRKFVKSDLIVNQVVGFLLRKLFRNDKKRETLFCSCYGFINLAVF